MSLRRPNELIPDDVEITLRERVWALFVLIGAVAGFFSGDVPGLALGMVLGFLSFPFLVWLVSLAISYSNRHRS